MLIWEEGKPEDCGIPSSTIVDFEMLLQKYRVRMHGYMMISGKRIIAERYYAPYTQNSLHRMYSVTKSFVALAVGLLVKDGLVKPEDKICDYFPEKLPEGGAHPWCAEMTIRDMLCMQTCYGSTTYKRYAGKDWTESFFRVEPDHVPGTVFSYDTSSAHVLAALVEKLTGMKMLDYMRRELLGELGFSKEAYILEDPVGVSQGGSGMMSTLRDIAGVAYLCNHFGVLDGRELLPTDFVREAVANQVPTDLQPKLDEQFGYGYFIWMPREEGFTFFGMGGQLAVCFPQYDFCYLTMADVNGSPAGVQILYDCFFRTVYPYLERRNKERALSGSLQQDFQGQRTQVQGTQAQGTQVQRIQAQETRAQEAQGKELTIRRKTQSVPFRFYPNRMGWEQLTFDWEQGELRFVIPVGEFTLRFGQEAVWVPQHFLNTGYRCECRGYWKMGHFILQCFLTDEEQGNVQMDFAWKDSYLSVRIVSTSDPFIQEPELQKCFQGFASAKMQG